MLRGSKNSNDPAKKVAKTKPNENQYKDNKENTEPPLQKEKTTSAECSSCGMVFLNNHSLTVHKDTFCLGYKETTEIEMTLSESPPIITKYTKQNQSEMIQNSPPINEFANNSANQNQFLNNNQNHYQPQLSTNSQYQTQYSNNNSNMNSFDFEQQIPPRNNSIQRSDSRLDPRETQNLISKLNEFKKKKSMEQSLKDMEDTLIRDTIRDKKLAVSITNAPLANTSITPSTSANIHGSTVSVKSSQISLQSSDPYKELLIEYGDFKKLEKNVLQEIFHYDPSFIPFRNQENKENKQSASNDFLSLFENSEIEDFDIDYLDTISFTAPPAPVAGAKMSNDTRNNLQRINEKTIQLEKDRQEIQLKLEALRNDTSLPIPVQSNQSLNRILAELRDQQRINEAALNMLSQRLHPDGPQSNGALQLSNRANNTNRQAPMPPIHNNQGLNNNNNNNGSLNDKVKTLFNSYIEADLSHDEIRMMRLNYLQGGGSDQVILNKFTEMENNSRSKHPNSNPFSNHIPARDQLVQYPQSNQYQYPQSSNHRNSQFQQNQQNQQIDPLTVELDKKIRKVDHDNRRLTAELADLQERYQSLSSAVSSNNFLDKPLSPNKPITPKYAYDSQLKKRSDNSLPPISQRSPIQQNRIKYEKQYIPAQEQVAGRNSQSRNSRISHQSSLRESRQQQAPQPKILSSVGRANDHSVNSSRSVNLKDLSLQPYDPNGGFVIFLDFITNLDPSYGCARVITCLHHPKSGLGEPSLLPVVNTEPYVENNSKTSVALVSTKQPVPRCPAQQALTILVELQMATTNSNETKLKSCGWTKIQLFDTKNRLQSGRWKLPLKRLPIQSDVPIHSLNQLPEFGTSELHYRLVNLRDSDEQTNAPISPSFSNQYQLSEQ